ncbi:MAG: arylesterase [Rhodospirillaceae bacterium]|nr:arylesterase [Rhodospirillaceae bacterium]|tara:strand:+ start:360 stop:1013 length:654 start_codon:yes stop_codon:yes gene_type:complete
MLKKILIIININIFFVMFLLLISYQKAYAEMVITVLGDSLVSGYGVTMQNSFPSLLQKELLKNNVDVKVINAGLSGDTSAGGLERLEWVLQDNPNILILVLGSNDMLRGVNPESTKKNLEAIITKSIGRNITVLLCGMKSGNNMGKSYKEKFDAIYISLKNRYPIYFYPFFLDGVALNPTLNQDDLMHPNKSGIKLIVKNIYPIVSNIIEDTLKRSD